MDLKSKVVRVTAKNLLSGKEEEGEKTGVVSRVVDNNRIAVTIPVSVPAKLVSVGPSFAPARVCDTVQLLLQNYSNFKRSGEPARFMRYVDESWVDVEPDVFEAVKAGFLKGISSVEAEIGGSKCLFDLHRMIELNLDTENFRSVAWIDVKGMCFFPKSFVCSHDGENDLVNSGEESKNEVVGNANESRNLVHQKLEIEIKITEDLQKEANNLNDNEVNVNKRKREINEPEGSSTNFPAKRKHVEECEFVSPRWPKSRLLGEQEEGYRIVKNLFVQGMTAVGPGAAITAIHQRVRRTPMERADYDAFQKQAEIVRQARGGNPNVVFAWFGTTAKGVESIMSHGFGTIGMAPGSGAPGVGLYLSPARTPRMSALMAQVDENGEKHVILCRVILGKCEKIEVGSLQLSHSRMDFDTGVDDLKEPQWYGVWGANMNTRILPECVLSYRPANRVPGHVTAASSHKFAPNAASAFYHKLISKLKSSLPPPKVHELQTLYCSLMDGKLGKDGFMKELGSVVGDEVLRSTIQEIRG